MEKGKNGRRKHSSAKFLTYDSEELEIGAKPGRVILAI